ncbi:MAG: hypothetical protein HY314_14620 [Acidobacteria bacterium]|nr:hypothetical protein [Acidobacteriota bacterium]
MRRLLTLVALIPLITSLTHLAAAERASQRKSVTIPADTVFRVRLNHNLTSRTAKVGDTFTATVTAPVAVGHLVAVPEGSTVHGRITSVTKAARRKNGTIAVTFYKLELPSRRTHQIYGSLVSLEEPKGGEVGEEGEVKGKSTTKRNVVFIGGGAGVGAAIGAAAGGGKGAGIGAAIGAGAGVAGALLTKGHEAEVDSGTEFGMALDRAVTVAVNAGR